MSDLHESCIIKTLFFFQPTQNTIINQSATRIMFGHLKLETGLNYKRIKAQ